MTKMTNLTWCCLQSLQSLQFLQSHQLRQSSYQLEQSWRNQNRVPSQSRDRPVQHQPRVRVHQRLHLLQDAVPARGTLPTDWSSTPEARRTPTPWSTADVLLDCGGGRCEPTRRTP